METLLAISFPNTKMPGSRPLVKVICKSISFTATGSNILRKLYAPMSRETASTQGKLGSRRVVQCLSAICQGPFRVAKATRAAIGVESVD